MVSAGDVIRASDIDEGNGLLDYTEGGSDVVLSVTAGTYVTIITGATVSVLAGKLYRVNCVPGSYLITAGSTWATSDTWRFLLERDDGLGGGFIAMSRSRAQRPNVAIASVTDCFAMIGYYSPAADGTVAFRARGSKTSGSVNVTSTVSVDGGAGSIDISVECIGDYGSSLH